MTQDMKDFCKYEHTLVSALVLLREATTRTIQERAEVRSTVFADATPTQRQEVVKLLAALSCSFSGLVSAALLLELTLLGRVSPQMRRIFELLGNDAEDEHAFTIAKQILAWDAETIRGIRDKMIDEAMSEDDA